MSKIPWYYVSFGDEEFLSLKNTFDIRSFGMGPITRQFEEKLAEYIDVPYVVATSSGTAALTMALMALDIGKGDEVIVPNRTWIATAHAVTMVGAKVVLVDVESDTPLISVEAIEKSITPKTRAIIPVHLGGRIADMESINSIANKYNLSVIEDSAQALGAKFKGRHAGTLSDIGCFSLSMGKLIATGQGGFCVTKNKDLYEKLRLLRSQGVDDILNPKYTINGFNFRITDLQSSLGLAQTYKIDRRIEYLNKIYSIYEKEFEKHKKIELIPVDYKSGEVPLYIEVLCEEREKIINYLSNNNIQTRPFYPDLDNAEYLKVKNKHFSNSKIFSSKGLFLPSGPDQKEENVHHVISLLHSYY